MCVHQSMLANESKKQYTYTSGILQYFVNQLESKASSRAA